MSCDTVHHLPSVVVLQDLFVSDGSHPVIVKLEPTSIFLRLDQCEVVSAVQIPGMDQYTV